jgi:hypothetical protein
VKRQSAYKRHVEKLVNKKSLKQKRNRKCCNGWKWTPTISNGQDELVGGLTCNGLRHEKTCCEIFYEHGEQWWHVPKLLNGLKCESKLKIAEEQGVGACSLACSTLEG